MSDMPKIRIIKPLEAVKILTEHGFPITANALRLGMQQERFPFGTAIEMPGEWNYYIYENLLMEWIAERDGSQAPSSALGILRELRKMFKSEVTK